jgi:hypothetical protein
VDRARKARGANRLPLKKTRSTVISRVELIQRSAVLLSIIALKVDITTLVCGRNVLQAEFSIARTFIAYICTYLTVKFYTIELVTGIHVLQRSTET